MVAASQPVCEAQDKARGPRRRPIEFRCGIRATARGAGHSPLARSRGRTTQRAPAHGLVPPAGSGRDPYLFGAEGRFVRISLLPGCIVLRSRPRRKRAAAHSQYRTARPVLAPPFLAAAKHSVLHAVNKPDLGCPAATLACSTARRRAKSTQLMLAGAHGPASDEQARTKRDAARLKVKYHS